MINTTKYLCVCQYGHSRSVAMTRVLHARGLQAVAVGWYTSPDWLIALSHAADKIIALESKCIVHIPETCRNKIILMDIGPDRWSDPYNAELYAMLSRLVDTKLLECL